MSHKITRTGGTVSQTGEEVSQADRVVIITDGKANVFVSPLLCFLLDNILHLLTLFNLNFLHGFLGLTTTLLFLHHLSLSLVDLIESVPQNLIVVVVVVDR